MKGLRVTMRCPFTFRAERVDEVKPTHLNVVHHFSREMKLRNQPAINECIVKLDMN